MQNQKVLIKSEAKAMGYKELLQLILIQERERVSRKMESLVLKY